MMPLRVGGSGGTRMWYRWYHDYPSNPGARLTPAPLRPPFDDAREMTDRLLVLYGLYEQEEGDSRKV
jgi:hypothetical protein